MRTFNHRGQKSPLLWNYSYTPIKFRSAPLHVGHVGELKEDLDL